VCGYIYFEHGIQKLERKNIEHPQLQQNNYIAEEFCPVGYNAV
jgi:hypothetical protein